MQPIKVAELFAGVGGFRLALDGYASTHNPEFAMPSAGNFETVWANQWEPPGTPSKQFAYACYTQRFGENSCINQDIAAVLDNYQALLNDDSISDDAKQADSRWIPDIDCWALAGAPC